MHHCKTEASYKRPLAFAQCGVALIPTLLTVLTLIACAAAVWQWQRSEYHIQKATTASALLQQPSNLNIREPKALSSTGSSKVSADIALPEGYATVTGTWLANSTTFVSPRMMDGRMGAQVISILAYIDAAGKTRHIAVQRGWAAQNQPNTAPSIAPLTQATVNLQGELVSALPRAYELKSLPPQSLGFWQNYDAQAHAQLLKIILQSKILMLLPSSPDAEREQLRRIPAQQAIDSLKQKANSNKGYALQWLCLSMVGLVGLAWMWRSRFK